MNKKVTEEMLEHFDDHMDLSHLYHRNLGIQSCSTCQALRALIIAHANPIPREFVEKWAERLREWATDENSTLKLAENIIQIMLHELGHRIKGE